MGSGFGDTCGLAAACACDGEAKMSQNILKFNMILTCDVVWSDAGVLLIHERSKSVLGSAVFRLINQL